ncbi:DUF1254 domain-containing protein [Streptomyces tendae]|uniref:hypothetical protein n=1 Tax=Streptomyces tendae TaxID=1932 RepID=UPI00371D984E
MPILNAWSDAVGAPGYRQEKSTTMPFLLAGPSDHAAVHLLQDGTRVTPLSRWTGDPEEYTPPSDLSVAGGFDAVTARVSQVHRLSGRIYFARLDQLLVDNPPNPADAAFVERLSRLGISPGARLDDQPQDVLAVLDAAAASGPKTLQGFKSQAEEAGVDFRGTVFRRTGSARWSARERWTSGNGGLLPRRVRDRADAGGRRAGGPLPADTMPPNPRRRPLARLDTRAIRHRPP